MTVRGLKPHRKRKAWPGRNRAPGGLFDDAELRPPPGAPVIAPGAVAPGAVAPAIVAAVVARRRLALGVGEDHALAGLARVDAEHSAHRNAHGERHAAEAGAELDQLVAQAEVLGRRGADVQHHLAFMHVLLWNLDAFLGGVHHDVRRLAVVGDPVHHGPQQVGPARPPGLAAGAQGRISCSSSVRLARKEGRLNRVSAYLMMLRPWLGGRSTSQCGSRHRMGPMLQSTRENSSLMKKGFTPNSSALESRLSRSALRALLAVRLSPRSRSSTSEYQSRSMW